jgi:hypothetical protein
MASLPGQLIGPHQSLELDGDLKSRAPRPPAHRPLSFAPPLLLNRFACHCNERFAKPRRLLGEKPTIDWSSRGQIVVLPNTNPNVGPSVVDQAIGEVDVEIM